MATSPTLAQLQAAVDGAIDVVLQPIVDLHTGRAVGYEAFARFPTTPPIPPPAWFDAARRAGLDLPLEVQVLTVVLRKRAGVPPDVFVSANLSPHLLAAPELQQLLRAVSPLSSLVVELPEPATPAEGESACAALAGLREAGLRVALDDSGDGYAGLSHIAAFRPEFIKLDRGIVAGLTTDPLQAASAAMFLRVACRIGATVIAEGIETLAQRDALTELGVRLGQGHLLDTTCAGA